MKLFTVGSCRDFCIHTLSSRLNYYCTTLRKKSPYSELFWSLFSRIRTEYGQILRISPYLVRMWQKTDQNNSESGHFLLSVVFVKNQELPFYFHYLGKVQKCRTTAIRLSMKKNCSISGDVSLEVLFLLLDYFWLRIRLIERFSCSFSYFVLHTIKKLILSFCIKIY